MSDIGQSLKRLCDAFNAHDLDRIMDFFADDCVLEMPRGSRPWGSRFEGKANVRAALAGRFEGLPDVHYGNEQHFVDDAAGTGISKWTLTGTRRVLIFPREPDPTSVVIRTISTETPDPALTERVLRTEQLSWWLLCDFQAVDGPTYGDMGAEFDTYGEAEAAFDTYGEAETALP